MQPSTGPDQMFHKIGQLTMQLDWYKAQLDQKTQLHKVSETAYEELCKEYEVLQQDHAALKAGYEALVNKPG